MPSDSAVEHQWVRPHFIDRDYCRKCGIVRPADDRNSPCKGKVIVGLRADRVNVDDLGEVSVEPPPLKN